jgi:hypothetical protein
MDRPWESDRLTSTFSLWGYITQNVHATEVRVQVRDDLINRIPVPAAGIRANLDNWIVSGPPLDVAGKCAFQVEEVSYAVLVKKCVKLYTSSHYTMRLVLNVMQNSLKNVNDNICMNAQWFYFI